MLSVDAEQSVVHVKRARGKAKAEWTGGGGAIHTRIVQRMRQVLQEDTMYGYLHERARRRLDQARRLARDSGMAYSPILAAGPGRFLLLPWRGTTAMKTMERLLRHAGMEPDLSDPPFYCELAAGSASMGELQQKLAQLAAAPPTAAEIAA